MRATIALLSLVVLIGSAGCGSAGQGGAGDDSPTDTASKTEPPPDLAFDVYTTSSWFMITDRGDPTPDRPPVKELAVFQAPARPFDRFPTSLEEDPSVYADVPEKHRPGREIVSESRLLLATTGAEQLRLFGVPSEKGWVCVHLLYPDDLPGGSTGSCVPDLPEGVAFWMGGTESSYELFGLVAGDVREVLVIAQMKSHPAVMGRNAFLFQADPKEICPTEINSLILDRAKGQSQKVELYPGLRRSEEDGAFGCV